MVPASTQTCLNFVLRPETYLTIDTFHNFVMFVGASREYAMVKKEESVSLSLSSLPGAS